MEGYLNKYDLFIKKEFNSAALTLKRKERGRQNQRPFFKSLKNQAL